MEEILNLHNQGKTVLQIKENLKCSQSKIRRALKINNLTPNVSIRRITEKDRMKMILLFDRGERFAKIAETLGINASLVRIYLNSKNRYAKYYGKILPELEQKILEEYDLGNVTIKKLAEKYKVSPPAMRTWLRKRQRFAPTPNEVHRKYEVNHNYFENIDLPEKAYTLGLLYADGCNFLRENKIILILKQTDKLILEKIKNKIQPSKPLYYKEPSVHKMKNGKTFNSSGSYNLTIVSKKMCADLVKLGLNPRKSLKLTFPNFIPEELMPDFIRGFFDGDGSISGHKVSFCASKGFLLSLQKYLIDKIKINKTKLIKNIKSEAHNFCFGAKQDVKNFRDYIYNNSEFFIVRKKQKFYEL